jgi:hypothetical protein
MVMKIPQKIDNFLTKSTIITSSKRTLLQGVIRNKQYSSAKRNIFIKGQVHYNCRLVAQQPDETAQ